MWLRNQAPNMDAFGSRKPTNVVIAFCRKEGRSQLLHSWAASCQADHRTYIVLIFETGIFPELQKLSSYNAPALPCAKIFANLPVSCRWFPRRLGPFREEKPRFRTSHLSASSMCLTTSNEFPSQLEWTLLGQSALVRHLPSTHPTAS